jgi:hypothetical protein
MEVVEITDQALGKIDRKEVVIGVEKMQPDKINLLPSLGTPDLAQYIQTMPGVVNTGDQGGQVYIRGGTMIQNMTLLDGAVIYSPFHSIGLFSVFDTDYLRDADMYSAAFPANFGDFKKFKGKVHINPVTTGVLLEGPFSGKNKPENKAGGSSYLISARRGILDRTSTVLYPYAGDSAGLPYNFTDIYGKTTFSDGANMAMIFGFLHEFFLPCRFQMEILWWRSKVQGPAFRIQPDPFR